MGLCAYLLALIPTPLRIAWSGTSLALLPGGPRSWEVELIREKPEALPSAPSSASREKAELNA